MKLYCTNYNCKNNTLIDPINFSYRKNYVPLGKDEGYCKGKCQNKFSGFTPVGIETYKSEYSLPICIQEVSNKCFCECIWNNSGVCEREELFIDAIEIDGINYWICKCQSDKKFEGHRDWQSLLKPDGTAKGGLIDDDYARKMHEDSKKFKVGSHLLKFGKE